MLFVEYSKFDFLDNLEVNLRVLTPFIKIFPPSMSFNLSKTFAIVDLPEPVAPTIAKSFSSFYRE